jgi:hypothetical protein
MSFNVFGCPVSSLNHHKDVRASITKVETAYHSCGIWTQASYINHRCTSNARRSFIGDMMIVRATQDLEADTEITFWYKPPTGDHSENPQDVHKNWGFACDCAMCQDVKRTKAAVVAERRKILGKMKRVCDSSNVLQVGQLERLLKTLDHTYTQPADEVPRLLLWAPQLLLVRVYMAQNNIIKGLESVGKVLTALGFIVDGMDASSTSFRVVKWGFVVDHLVETFLHARTAFKAMGAEEHSRTAETYAKCAYKMVVGEDVSFESTYSGEVFDGGMYLI